MESQLRLTSASLIDRLSRLEELERTKRDLESGSPEQLRLSHEVEALARQVLDAATLQSDLVEELATTRHASARASDPGPRREIHLILAEWRDAERRLSEEVPGSTGWEAARLDVERLRDEYRGPSRPQNGASEPVAVASRTSRSAGLDPQRATWQPPRAAIRGW